MITTTIVAEKFARTTPQVVTWELKVRQMGLQKKELAQIMVDQLDLTCSPDEYLEETYKHHLELFGEVTKKFLIFSPNCIHFHFNFISGSR